MMRAKTLGEKPTCSRKICEKRRSLQPVLEATSRTVAMAAEHRKRSSEYSTTGWRNMRSLNLSNRNCSRPRNLACGVGSSRRLSRKDRADAPQMQSRSTLRLLNRWAQSRTNGGKTTRLEDDADEIGQVGCVDDLVDRTGAHYESWGLPNGVEPIRAVKQEIAGEVQDDLDAASGQNALLAVGRVRDAAHTRATGCSGRAVRPGYAQ
jgi:hypothetical protein